MAACILVAMKALELKIPPAAVAFIIATAMWLVARNLPGPLIPWRQALALAFAGAGVAVALAGVMEFRRARTTVNPMKPEKASALVASGVFRLSRNPMYVGILFVLAGWGAWLGNLPALLLLPLFVAYMNRFQIVPEERAMQARFGAGYASYVSSVRRWL